MNGEKSWGWDGIKNTTTARILQEYISAFVVKGNPNDEQAKWKAPNFPTYGQSSNVMDFTPASIKVVKDDTANQRCDWWKKGLIY
jgi:carboxylesterase type B